MPLVLAGGYAKAAVMGLRWLLSTLVLSCACRLDAFDDVSRGAGARADGGRAKGPA